MGRDDAHQLAALAPGAALELACVVAERWRP